MIPTEIKLALYRIALYCKEQSECPSCPLSSFCYDVFDINPKGWEKKLAEDK